jgi:CHASE3 domain sensor protein
MRILRGKTYIPKKNYIKFYLIVFLTIIVGFVFFFSYEKYKE